MRWRATILGAAALLFGAAASAQPVRVDTVPSRATLVCDGRVVGVTPTAVDPASVRACTLYSADHDALAVDLDAIHGVVARFFLTASSPTCGRIDPHTGLLIPCFPRVPAAVARRPRCGHVDPRTGLLVPCFERAAPAPTAPCVTHLNAQGLLVPCSFRPVRESYRLPVRAASCGHVDPHTGLLVPCFGVSAPPGRRR